jgi:NAD(P)H-quinone oxidoreductase subunit 2
VSDVPQAASAAIAAGLGGAGLNLQLNAAAIAPEAAVLAAMLACLLVDLAGEKAASRWVPPICYGGLGSALVLLALQWNGPLEPSFLGSFLADNLAIAFRAVVAASTLISLLLSWRYVERSGTPVGEYASILLAATLGAMFLCGATDLISIFISLETLSVASYLLAGYMKRDARSSEAAQKYLEGKEIKKVIAVPGKLVNFVVV